MKRDLTIEQVRNEILYFEQFKLGHWNELTIDERIEYNNPNEYWNEQFDSILSRLRCPACDEIEESNNINNADELSYDYQLGWNDCLQKHKSIIHKQEQD